MGTKVGSFSGLMIVTSFMEGSTGLALMTSPSFFINLLFGSPISDSISVILAKVGGSALVSLALASWFSRKSESIIGLIIALLFYNLASVVLLGYAGLHENLNGIALWPAVAIHMAMALWSGKSLISYT